MSRPAERAGWAAAWTARVRATAARWQKDPVRAAVLALILASAAYTAFLGWVLVARYWAFQTYAWDLGVYNQSFFTTLYSHRVFYYTADIPSGNPGSIFSGHFAPILFLVLPLYALAPGPGALLVVQAAALAAGAVPAYLLARQTTGSNAWAIPLGASYLASPVLMGLAWYDFHLESFLPAAVLWTLYFYYVRRFRWFLLAWGFTLAVIETIAPFLVVFAVAGLLGALYARFRGRPVERFEYRSLTAGALLAIAWLPVAYFVIGLSSHTLFAGTLGAGYSTNWTVLGPNLSFFTAVPYALSHPAAALSALRFQGSAKVAYALVLFGSVGFLPFLGPKRLLLPAVAWFSILAVSDATSFYQFGDQYSAYALPFLVAGAAFGLARVRRWLAAQPPVSAPGPAELRRRARWRGLRRGIPTVLPGVWMFAGVAATTLVVSPLLADPHFSYAEIPHGLPALTPADRALHRIIAMIPDHAAVLTFSAAFPELSNRPDAYVVPVSSYFAGNLTFTEWLNTYVNRSSYVLLDLVVDYFSTAVVLSLANLSGFGLLAEADGAMLYERGWSGPPVYWVPFALVLPGGDLTPTQYSYPDRSAATPLGPPMATVHDILPAAILWTGPFLYDLPPGTYRLTERVALDANGTGPQLEVDCVANAVNVTVAPFNVSPGGRDYSVTLENGARSLVDSAKVSAAPNGPVEQNLTMTFTWGVPLVWSTSAVTLATIGAAWLYEVDLVQTSPA